MKTLMKIESSALHGRFFSVFVLSLLISVAGKSQIIEVDGGIGYTAVDMESFSGMEAEDWSNMSSYFNVQFLFPISPKVSVGAGVGYQYLFWAYFESVGYTVEAEATRVTAISRFHFNRNFIDLTVGAYIFEDYTNFAGGINIGHAFPLSEKFSLPIKISTTVIVDAEATMVPITVGAGLSYKFK